MANSRENFRKKGSGDSRTIISVLGFSARSSNVFVRLGCANSHFFIFNSENNESNSKREIAEIDTSRAHRELNITA